MVPPYGIRLTAFGSKPRHFGRDAEIQAMDGNLPPLTCLNKSYKVGQQLHRCPTFQRRAFAKEKRPTLASRKKPGPPFENC